MYFLSQKVLDNKIFLYFCTPKSEDSVAQQVEHIPFKDGVLGSSPSWITSKLKQPFSIEDGCFFYNRNSINSNSAYTIR